jgi:hypothetical protein
MKQLQTMIQAEAFQILGAAQKQVRLMTAISLRAKCPDEAA